MSNLFVAYEPGPDDFWRAIILFGAQRCELQVRARQGAARSKARSGSSINQARGAGAALLRRTSGNTSKEPTKQGTSPRSKFLDACRKANMGELTDDELVGVTVRLGV